MRFLEPRSRSKHNVLIGLMLAGIVGCAHRDRTSGVPPAFASSSTTIVAAGDIACDPNSDFFNQGLGTPGHCQMKATSDLVLSMHPAAVLALGDEQYEQGTTASFERSFDPSWGRFKQLIHPVPGNHEYWTADAKGYFDYFGSAAGPKGLGYYSFDIGGWHIIALNSNCDHVQGCGEGSAQQQWLVHDLKEHSGHCTLAYWHNARFSSGLHGSDSHYQAFWHALYDAGADLILVGHDHDYERFAPLDSLGRLDQKAGIREFVVGTGGKNRRGFTSGIPFSGRRGRYSEFRDSSTFGVLELSLADKAYAWRFVTPSNEVRDFGAGTCHLTQHAQP